MISTIDMCIHIAFVQARDDEPVGVTGKIICLVLVHAALLSATVDLIVKHYMRTRGLAGPRVT